ncbi:MAG: glutamine synthetase family protein [Coprothermobacterota bacterium]|nr:glutamine synthetase family protein [Coprothermobacterota bacterium]
MVQSKIEIIERLKKEQVRFVSLQFTDLLGMVKNVTLPVQRFIGDCLEYGTWFDGSSIEGFARIAESDMFLVPDLETFAVVPWDRGQETTTARFICDVYTPQGQPFAGDPRQVLRCALGEAEKMGFSFQTGPEPEFFIFKAQPDGIVAAQPHDRAGYFDVSTDVATQVRRQMVNALSSFGIEVEAHHHEVSIGQHEIDFHYAEAMQTADNVITLRLTVKAVAQRNNLYATFMPKPIFGINGSGLHVHQSLTDLQTGGNLFVDRQDPYGISYLAKRFIAGQLHHARGMCAVLAPLVNSYKRLVPGFEAPVYISWGCTNRSALIRVPRINPRQPEATRLELRCPDPSCNPYLAFAVMLACGLDGIKRDLPLPEAAEEDLYHLENNQRLPHLPGSLREAVEELEKDEVVAQALGEHVFQRYLEAKTLEWQEYRRQVTTWELERYLPVF